MAGVVDAGRELVRQQASFDLEELERQDADVAELVQQAAPVRLGLRLRRPGGRRTRLAQDPVSVNVLDERPEARVAVAAPDGEQRELAVEWDELLEDVSGDSPRNVR